MRRPAPSAFSPAAPAALSRAAVEIEYPSSDGKPLAENDAQHTAILYGVGALGVYYAGRRDVYVSCDLLIYYEEGNPRVSVAPDVFVVFGVEDRMRMNYKVWEEGKGPDFVLEVASPSTWREDVGRKRDIYARLGVREYWLYDPLGEHLKPALQGNRLVDGEYERQPLLGSLDGRLGLRSETLGLDLLSHDEEHDRAEREVAARQREAAARQATAARAETEAAARRSAEARAEREAAARQREAVLRQAAEARVAELEALIGGKRG